MARTIEGRRLTARHRNAQLSVRATALRAIREMWQGVDPTNLAGTITTFSTGAALAVRGAHRESADLAARYVRDLRQAEQVPGVLAVTLAEPPDRDVAAAALRGAGLAGIIRARQRGFSPGAAARNGFVRASGAASSLVLSGGRDIVDQVIRSDRRAVGWMRVTGADPCDWCAMLASRGPVFKTAETAGFEPDQFHDHDGCQIEPVYDRSARDDRSQWPASSRRLREEWDESTSGLSGREARRAFRRAREGRPIEGDPIAT